MKYNVLLATIVAVMTAAGAVAVFYPATVIAEDTVAGPPPEIANPVLAVNGCELTIALVDDVQLGGPLVVLLTATNTTDQPVELSVTATAFVQQSLASALTEAAPADTEANADAPADGDADAPVQPAPPEIFIGRSMPMMIENWQETVEISLAAGETKEIQLTTSYVAEAGAAVTLSLYAGDQAIGFDTSVPLAPAEPTEEPAGDGPLGSDTTHL